VKLWPKEKELFKFNKNKKILTVSTQKTKHKLERMLTGWVRVEELLS
jgi:hypothetical protein